VGRGLNDVCNVSNGEFMSITASLETGRGTIILSLTPQETPKTVANFVNLILRGYYDGLTFHRVIADFMIQGGDPEGKGFGGPGYRFEDEFAPTLRHDRAGVLSMANAGPGTNGSQFFITHGPTPHLDGRHTVFGRVIAGQEVVDAIRQGDVIAKATVSGDEGEVEALLENGASYLAEWNSILDTRYPRK
jgi:peptidyl-prolyl cis-trans isomerase B (cyclophilin B)